MAAPEATPRTVLVTGAAGFIGYAVCRRLIAGGHRVVAYDDLSRGRREYLPEGVPLIEADIRDRVRMREAIAKWRPEWLVHLAAMHFIPYCIARPAEAMEVNVDGTRHVLDACRGSSVRNVVLASTGAVYAPTDGACVEDMTPLGPLEVYGESKLAAERLAAAFFEATGVNTTILRLFNAIGENETNPHVIPHILESLRETDAIALGNTAPRRDYIDTRDIAGAIVQASEVGDGLRTFNVGTGVAVSVDDIIELLRRITGRPITALQDRDRLRPHERMLLVADTARIRAAIGWEPRFRLADTLRHLVEVYGLRR